MDCSWRFDDDTRPWNGPAAALVGDFAQVAHLYPDDPFDPAAVRRRAAWLAGSWDPLHAPAGDQAGAAPHRQALAEALAAFQVSIEAPQAAVANARRLAEPGTLAVVSGQQAGLFTGPAYTLYKALAVVRLARQWERELGRPVVPVFWVASEDHDYNEAAVAAAFDEHGRRATFRLPPAAALRSVGGLPIPAVAERMAREMLAGVRSGGVDAAWVEDAVLGTLARSRTLGEWFARQLSTLLGGDGLVLLDPLQPAMRRLSSSPLARLMERAPELLQALADGEAAVRQAGYEPQMKMEAGQLHLFRYVGKRPAEAQRLALALDGEQVATRHGEWQLDGAGAQAGARLAVAIRAQPEWFSPAAALRPLVQDWLLPTLAQVGGPGELAYLPETKAAYAVAGWEPPLWIPRLSATVVWPEWQAQAEEWAVDLPVLADEAAWREALQRWLARHDGVDPDDVFAQAKHAVDAIYGDVAAALQPVSPHLGRIGEVNQGHVQWQLDYFRDKALQHQRRAHAAERREWQRVHEALAPGGAPQERAYCVYALFGPLGYDAWRAFVETAPLPPVRSWAAARAQVAGQRAEPRQ